MGSAFADVWEQLVLHGPGGWTHRAPGALGSVTGSAIPTLNGVWVYDEPADSAAVAELLDRVAADGVPHCLQLASACAGELHELPAARGMRREVDIPLMALTDPELLPDTGQPDLVITALEPQRASIHAELTAAGFDAPAEEFRRLLTPEVLGAAGARAYVAEVDGEPVATGAGFQLGETVGIFNIATLPAHRRRGLGAAITASAIRDAVASGARWAWLQSSPAGYHIYETLGFETLDSWECWVAT